MTYRLWFRSISLGFVSYRALVLDQCFYQLDFGRHRRGSNEGQAGLWDVDERYARLSSAGDPLERLITVVRAGVTGTLRSVG